MCEPLKSNLKHRETQKISYIQTVIDNEENNYYFGAVYADMDTCTKLVEW